MDRYAKGLPCGGAFDAAALEAANRAVGNDPQAAALEISFVGPRLRMVGEAMLSWHGSTAEILVNGHCVTAPQQLPVNDGDVVAIGRVAEGVRGVLAVRGAIADPAAPFAVSPDLVLAATRSTPARVTCMRLASDSLNGPGASRYASWRGRIACRARCCSKLSGTRGP